MKRPRILRWDVPETGTPHPYRDSALLWAAAAVAIVLIAWASGGPLGRAVIYAAVFFVVATVWSWYRWRARLRRRR